MRQDHRTLGTEVPIVLDAHAAPIRPIDPRHYRHHRTFGERPVRGLREPGRLMHLQPEAMAQAVSEQIPKTALLNVVSGECVGIPARHAGPNVCRRALIGDANDFIETALLLAGAPYYRGARDVSTVTTYFRAKIEQKKIAMRDLSR